MNPYRILGVLALCFVAGCATAPDHQASSSDSLTFFTDPSLLVPVQQRPGVTRYISSEAAAQRRGIDSVYLAPIEVWLDPASPYKGLTQSDIAALGEGLRKALEADARRPYPLVDTPSANTLVVRVALTGLELTRDRTKLLSFTPVGLVVKGITHAAGVSPLRVDRLGVQAEGTIGPNGGKPVFAVRIDPSPSLVAPVEPEGDKIRLDQVPPRLAALAADLRATLEEVR